MENIDEVEAMLEQAWKKQREDKGEYESSTSKPPSSKRRARSSRSRSHDDSGSKKKRNRSRDRKRRSRSRSKPRRDDRRRRSRSRSVKRRPRSISRSRGNKNEYNRRGGDRYQDVRRRGGGGGGRSRSRSPVVAKQRSESPAEQLTVEERDARTVLVMQLRQHTKVRDLVDFFSSVGKVHDAKLICCNKNRFKGIAYVEFKKPESVNLALGLTGQKLLGAPIVVQLTQAEKNRINNPMMNFVPKPTGPTRLYVGCLHRGVTEGILKEIFEPFGKIDKIELIKDAQTNASKGFAFITFKKCEDAKNALDQMNGFELAGNAIKVIDVTDRSEMQLEGPSSLDSDEIDRTGVGLGASGRLQLMMKLAKNADFEIPQEAANVLSMVTGQTIVPEPSTSSIPAIATQCFMLTNMFDPASETSDTWDTDIRNDVIEECSKQGGVLHVYVDKSSAQGNVYVKSPTIAIAVASVNTLHGRCFAGRMVTASYIPISNYHSLFPDAMLSAQLLAPIV